jgi:hypothetical protein
MAYVLAALLAFLLPVFPAAGTAAAAAGDYVWTSIMGPGNGRANRLLFVPERNELYRTVEGRGVWCYDTTSGKWKDTGGGKNYLALAWDGTYLYAGFERYDPSNGTWDEISGPSAVGRAWTLTWGGSRLYAGTSTGLWIYDPAENSWTNAPGMDDAIRSLAWDGSGIYAGTEEIGVWRYDPESGTWTDTGGYHSYLSCTWCLTWNGSALYAGADQGVWHYDPGSGVWTRIEGNSGNIQYVRPEALAWDGSGLYVVTFSDGVFYYNPGSGACDPISVPFDKEYLESGAWGGTVLYVGSSYQGVWSFNPVDQSWTDTGGGISTDTVDALAWDGSYLYAGIYYSNQGVWRYDPVAEEWSSTNLGESCKCLLWNGSSLFAGTYKGVWRYDPGTGIWTDTGGGLSGKPVTCLAWSGSTLYAGTNGNGIWRFDPETNTWTDTYGGFINIFYINAIAWDGSGLYAAATINFGRPWPLYSSISSVWHYDQASQTWSHIGIPEQERGISSLAWDGSRLYAGRAYPSAKIWCYNPPTGTWNDISNGLSSSSSFLLWDGSSLYASAGHVWRYFPQTGAWENISSTAAFSSPGCLAFADCGLYAGASMQGVWHCRLPLVLSSIAPSSAPVGGEVTISGDGFGSSRGSSHVSFGGTPATEYVSWTNTQIKCKVPSMAAGKVEVTVTTAQGTSDPLPFEVTLPPPFTLTSVTPAQGSQLDLWLDLAVEGTGLQPGATLALRKGTAVIGALSVNVASETRLTATVFLFGAEPGEYDVVVNNPGGEEAVLSGGFTVSGACGQGAGASMLALGLMMGLLSLAGVGKRRRKQRR